MEVPVGGDQDSYYCEMPVPGERNQDEDTLLPGRPCCPGTMVRMIDRI